MTIYIRQSSINIPRHRIVRPFEKATTTINDHNLETNSMQSIYFDICLARSVLPNNLIITFTTYETYVIMCVFCLHSHILRNYAYANSSPSIKRTHFHVIR